jgi:hypothetical protein
VPEPRGSGKMTMAAKLSRQPGMPKGRLSDGRLLAATVSSPRCIVG